jgi:hypothetical protein
MVDLYNFTNRDEMGLKDYQISYINTRSSIGWKPIIKFNTLSGIRIDACKYLIQPRKLQM